MDINCLYKIVFFNIRYNITLDHKLYKQLNYRRLVLKQFLKAKRLKNKHF